MSLLLSLTWEGDQARGWMRWGDSLGLHNGAVHSIYNLLAVLSLTSGTPELLGQLSEVYFIPAPAGRMLGGLLTQHWLSGRYGCICRAVEPQY